MKIIKYLIISIALIFILALINRINRVQIKSNTGELSPYFKNRIWDKGIFYQTWSGDGLGGRYSYEKLKVNLKDTFYVLDTEVLNDGTKTKIAIGKHLDSYYFGATPLPFNPTNNNWKEGFPLFGDDLILITNDEVYLFSDETFTKIENAIANEFTKVGGFESSNELFTDKTNYYEIIYTEVTNSAGNRIMKATIKVKPVL